MAAEMDALTDGSMNQPGRLVASTPVFDAGAAPTEVGRNKLLASRVGIWCMRAGGRNGAQAYMQITRSYPTLGRCQCHEKEKWLFLTEERKVFLASGRPQRGRPSAIEGSAAGRRRQIGFKPAHGCQAYPRGTLPGAQTHGIFLAVSFYAFLKSAIIVTAFIVLRRAVPPLVVLPCLVISLSGKPRATLFSSHETDKCNYRQRHC